MSTSRINANSVAAGGAPRDLTAVVTGSNVKLTWTDPPDLRIGPDPFIDGYLIEAGSASGRTDLAAFLVGISPTLYSIDNVPAGTYFVRVLASNLFPDGSRNNGPASNEVRVVVGPSCQGPPGAFTLNPAAAGQQVTLTWTPASGTVTKYVVEGLRGTAPANFNQSQNFDVPADQTSFSPPLSDGMWTIAVRAINSCGNTLSNSITVQVGACQIPGAFTLAPATVVGQSVTLQWTAPAGGPVTGYLLDVYTGSISLTLDDVIVGAVTRYPLPNVSEGLYYVKMRAKSACGSGPQSNQIPVQVGFSRPSLSGIHFQPDCEVTLRAQSDRLGQIGNLQNLLAWAPLAAVFDNNVFHVAVSLFLDALEWEHFAEAIANVPKLILLTSAQESANERLRHDDDPQLRAFWKSMSDFYYNAALQR